MRDQTLSGHHPSRPCGRIPESVRIAPYPLFCVPVACSSSSASLAPLLQPSNGSLNCPGSLYGASDYGRLGLRGSQGCLPRSCSIGQSLADDASNRTLSAFNIVNAERDSV